MASNASQAGQAWHCALKLRKHLLKQLEKLQAEGASGNDVAQFEAIDGLLEKFRLACVQTIFLDFKYAVKENTEDALWGLHISINAEHRRNLGRLKHNSHPVERRKVEKVYNNFLRIAQKFYKGYIQRLSARYDVPELRRVARGIDVEQMGAEDTISPVPGSLSGLVLESCHATLLHLGDLARYRIQARHKHFGFESALTYYGLARHLMPNSGFAFHQMGIINIDQANHLDVVYHFYRAWTVDAPHPNAKSNLESEFKSLRLPHSVKPRGNPSAPVDVFGTWFVKLHAFFYNGEAFSQQKELEEEVMHRLEMAYRDASSGDTLLKMSLINMSAYDVAAKAHAGTKTASASRFWQFTLRFNALFILTFCRALHSELEEVVSNNSGSPSGFKVVEISSTVGSILPTLRIYCVWLAARREELFRSPHAFGATIPTMMHHMVKVFTLLCAVSFSRDDLAPCPYLLAEDLEVRGNRPLTGEDVPKACMVSCDEHGKTKPYPYDPERRLDSTKENLARILEILRCAYFLAEDNATPVTCQIVEDWLVFQYQPDATPGASQNVIKAAPASVEPPLAKPLGKPAKQTQPLQAQGSEELHVSRLHQDHVWEQQEPLSRETDCQLLALGSDETEKTVIAMLTPFLKPPTPQPHQRQGPSPAGVSSSSRIAQTPGVGRSGLMTYSSPTGSSFSGPMAPFPWAWDNTPKPDTFQDAAYTAGKEAFNRASGENSPQDPVTAQGSIDASISTLGRDALRTYTPLFPDSPGLGNVGSLPARGAEMPHRDHLLRAFVGRNAAPSFARRGEVSEVPCPNMGMGASPRTWQALDPFSASSGTSGFSHPSSLYLGTPADCVGLGVSGVAGQGRNQVQSPTRAIAASSATRRMQVDNAASR